MNLPSVWNHPGSIPWPVARRAWAAAAALLIASRMIAAAAEPASVPAPKAFHVVCSADRPLTSIGQPVEVMVFTDAPQPQSLRYRWNASAGGFSAPHDRVSDPSAGFEDAKAQWWPQNLKAKATSTPEHNPDLGPGSYTLSAVVTGAGGTGESCSVVVTVGEGHGSPAAGGSAPIPQPSRHAAIRPPAASSHGNAPSPPPAPMPTPTFSPAPAPNGYQSWRSLLVRGQAQGPGYGLYSYMLFGAPPDDSSRQAFLVFIDSYLNLIADVRGLESSTPLSALNITYLPVDSDPPATISSPTCPGHSAMACWVLEHYDYGMARALLASVPGARGRGPFIVSTLQMLNGSGAAVKPNLFEDLSGKPSSVVEFWVNQFLVQTTQQKFWQPTTLRALALNLRTAIAYAAEGFPMVQKAVPASLVFNDSK